MLFTIREVFDILIMILAVGFIFKDVFKNNDKLAHNAFLFACLVTAPALIAHELAHKFVAIAYGLQATFHAAYGWLAIGILLKLISFNFIFFVPAYVSVEGTATHLASALISVSGPFLNLLLFFGAWLLLKRNKLKTSHYILLQATKQINLFLFILNMLPLPFFDGFKFYQGIYYLLF